MAGVTSDERVAVPMLRAAWLTLAFVHWPVPPAEVQALLPDGLIVDEYDGSAWVSLTPFVMADIRPLGIPNLPGVPGPARLPRLPDLPSWPRIPETNLRTYVRGPDGRDGLWFFSLDVRSAALAVAARALIGAPYHWGPLTLAEHDGTTTYSGTRVGGPESYRLVVRAGEPITPSERDVWLTGRWRAYSRNYGTLLATPVQHEPWPLRAATLDLLEENLTKSVGLNRVAEQPMVHFSDGVHKVRMGIPRLLR